MVNVTVLGSINMDLVTTVQKHPIAGETVKGWKTEYCPGGKGANQAVATYFAGGNVTMIGALGNDVFAARMLKHFEEIGLQKNYILPKDSNSGLAFITVDAAGNNTIVLSEGANAALSMEDVKRHRSIIGNSDILLLQNEVPWSTTKYAIDTAHEKGVNVILNPSPAGNIDKGIFPKVDVVFVNESEAYELTGIEVQNYAQAKQAMIKLLEYGVNGVILTLGEHGSLYADKSNNFLYIPSYKVNVKDTTAAGDTFIGAFTAALSRKESIKNSLRFATAAAALVVTKKGAQFSIPRQSEIEEFLKSELEIQESNLIKGACENEISQN